MQHYRYAQEFDALCQFIFDSSPITFCSMGRVFQNGTYRGFNTNPEWAEFYRKKHCQETLTPWLEAEINRKSGTSEVWSMYSVFKSPKKTLQSLQSDIRSFNYHNGIHFIDVYPDYIELFRFASPKLEGIESFFLENQGCLRQFMLLIKEKMHQDKVLLEACNTGCPLPQALPTHLLQKAIPTAAHWSSIQKFYIGFPLQEGSYITKQEMQCLISSLIGIPSKVIAKQYQISFRTVDKHIERVKEKLVCKETPLWRALLLENQYVQAYIPDVLAVFKGILGSDPLDF